MYSLYPSHNGKKKSHLTDPLHNPLEKLVLISTMFTVFLGLEAPKEERFLQKCIMVLLN